MSTCIYVKESKETKRQSGFKYEGTDKPKTKDPKKRFHFLILISCLQILFIVTLSRRGIFTRSKISFDLLLREEIATFTKDDTFVLRKTNTRQISVQQRMHKKKLLKRDETYGKIEEHYSMFGGDEHDHIGYEEPNFSQGEETSDAYRKYTIKSDEPNHVISGRIPDANYPYIVDDKKLVDKSDESKKSSSGHINYEKENDTSKKETKEHDDKAITTVRKMHQTNSHDGHLINEMSDDIDELQAIWKGNFQGGDATLIKQIFLVIYHYCDDDLSWLNKFTLDIDIHQVFILTKCNKENEIQSVSESGILRDASMIKLPNVGGSSHAYAYWIVHNLSLLVNNDDAVVFIKGDRQTNDLSNYRSLSEMLSTSSINDFGCMSESWGWSDADISAYHDTDSLVSFKIGSQTMQEWLDTVDVKLPFPMTNVCYGDTFVVKASRVAAKGSGFWEKIEKALSKGQSLISSDNDNDFMERTWAGLLSKEISSEIMERIQSYVTGISRDSPYIGALLRHEVVNENGLWGILPETMFNALWRGDTIEKSRKRPGLTHLVISHCNETLNWLDGFLEGTHIDHTTIFSKCDAEVRNAPEGSTIVKLPNVGRCDHTYAHYMANLPSIVNDEDMIIFRKAGIDIHQVAHPRSIKDMLRIASVNGFGCWLELDNDLSAFHSTKLLLDFKMEMYRRMERDTLDDFASRYVNLGAWLEFVGGALPEPLTEVCYGGVFVVEASRIREKGSALWGRIEESLTRGNNIQEGHYAERSWAGLLARPISATNMRALREFSEEGPVKEESKISAYRGSMFRGESNSFQAKKVEEKIVNFLGPTLKRKSRAVHVLTEKIWNGDVYLGEPEKFHRIFVVVSHCNYSLGWLRDFTRGFQVEQYFIYSKCNNTIQDAPQNSTTIYLPNVGGSHHSFAHWIANTSALSSLQQTDAVVFVQDNPKIDILGRPRCLKEMLRIASLRQFGCRLKPERTRTPDRADISSYHDTQSLLGFRINETEYKGVDSKHGFENLGGWLHAVGGKLPEPLVQVCYGGIFAVHSSVIKNSDSRFWKGIENSLSRGENIEESYFMERIWAGLLSKKITTNTKNELLRYKTSEFKGSYYKGALVRESL